MNALLAIVDTETTGLNPECHEVWEVGLILRNGVERTEYLWHLPVDLGKADAVALTVGRYYERYAGDLAYDGRRDPSLPYDGSPVWMPTESFARLFARLTHGAHLVGAVPSFDDAFLKRLLRVNGACPGWHYHLVDVEALAIGYLSSRDQPWPPPWRSEDLTADLGIEVDPASKHTALGDARWAEAIYDVVMGTR